MTALLVRGGKRLTGRVEPSANKNAVLPVLCATLLSDAPITLRNVPEITDVTRIVDFFGELGSTVKVGQEAQGARDRSLDDLARCRRPPAAGDARLDHDDPRPAGPPRRGAARA